jgi:SAM-dependent methyltransferase
VEGYDRIAEAYAARFFRELDEKPIDRALLDLFAAEVRGGGAVADVGCGPGQVARYLAERGVDACGIDLAPEMVRVARALSPSLAFEVGSLLALPRADRSLAGAAAFYAIVNLPPDDVARALVELHRVLAPGAPMLLAFHLGDQRLHVDEMLGHAVSLDFWFFTRAFVDEQLRAAGFTIDLWLERRPYPTEHPSTRAYAWARRPR